MARLVLIGLLSLASISCLAHRPEAVAGPDAWVVTGQLPASPINIREDRWGIPHIRAASVEDAVFGLGLLHAEERLWQLELGRRVGSGRLSEILGPSTLATDRFLRTVGFARAASSSLEALGPKERRILEAYVAGINAVIAAGGELPPEYRILGIRPEPFTPLDSMVVTRTMAWLLTASASEDALLDRLTASLGPEYAELVLPSYPQDGPRTLPPDQMRELRGHGRELPPGEPDLQPEGAEEAPVEAPSEGRNGRSGTSAAGVALLHEILGTGPDVGSNSWAVHGSRTDTGAPILSNDPHLAAGSPSMWFLAELHCPGLHVIGATLPGLPGMPIGHNEQIAWGLTNTQIDVMDLYREQLHPEDPLKVRREHGWETLRVVEERIEVRGRPAPVVLDVRIGSNGPLVTEFFEGYDEEVALRWTALEPNDTTLSSFLAVMEASDWSEFLEALRGYGAPSQNFLYADREGHIGWKVPGRIPIRQGWDGRRAARGWVEADSWQGWIPFEELPEALDPLQGWLVSANNRPTPDDYPHVLRGHFAAPYRARRIIDLIEQGEGRSVAGHRGIQLDVLSAQAPDLLPTLAALEPSDPREQTALRILGNWDGSHDTDSAAAAIYNAWIVELAPLLSRRHSELGFSSPSGLNPVLLREVFRGSASELCVAARRGPQPATANCSEVAALALSRAVRSLTRALGRDLMSWRWGDLHRLHFDHPLGLTPALRRKLDTWVESPGGPWTVNVGGSLRRGALSRGSFTQLWYPSYRQVIDLSDWSKSYWMHGPGQSGVAWREHYRDLAAPHVAGEMVPMLFGPEATHEDVVRTRQIRR